MKQPPLLTKEQTKDLMLTKALMTTEFPTDRVPDGFAADLNAAMGYASVGGFKAQGFDRALYNRMRDWGVPFTCMEMRLAVKLVENCTPNEYLCEDASEYDNIQDRAEQVWAVYEELKAPIVEKIDREIDAKSKLIVPKGRELFKG